MTVHLARSRSNGDTRQRRTPARAPRLVSRFALLAAVCLGAGAAAILGVIRNLDTAQAERSAAHDANFVAQGVLSVRLSPLDFAAPVGADRRLALDDLFRQTLLSDRALLVTLQRADGEIVYSTDHGRIGAASTPSGAVRAALRGTATSSVRSIVLPGARRPSKVLESTVPIVLAGSRTGSVTIDQDYAPIASAARAAFLPVAGVLECVLIALYLLLIPLLARSSRRISRQMNEIECLAYSDAVTGLPNGASMREQLAEMLRAGDQPNGAAVMLVGLERFDEISTTLGRPFGHELLAEVGDRLKALLRDDAKFGRLEGSYFEAILPNAGRDEALAVAERLRSTLEAPFNLHDMAIAIDASIGIVRAPEHGVDPDVLLRHAETAVHAARQGRSGVVFYTETLDSEDPSRVALLAELRSALDGQQLVVHYQPQATTSNGAIVGVEALVRWQHPERGLLEPPEFVPFAEQTGLSRALFSYVLGEGLAQLRTWRENGIELTLAVNLTMFELLDPNLIDKIAAALSRWNVEPHLLELEITESAIMADPEQVIGTLTSLGELGVKLTVDDFGTGYSSLNYLKLLPVDAIKIDRAFISQIANDARDSAIVRSTIDLAHELGRLTVAEGVETRETFDHVAALGCDLIQGFYLGRPEPADALTPKLLERRADARLRREGITSLKDRRARTKNLADAV